MQKFIGREEGFTLVEVLTALAVLGIVIAALSGLFAGAYTGAFLAGARSEANALAQEKMEMLASLDYSRGIDDCLLKELQGGSGVEGPLGYGGPARHVSAGSGCSGCLEGKDNNMRWTACAHRETLLVETGCGRSYEVSGFRFTVAVYYREDRPPLLLTSFAGGE